MRILYIHQYFKTPEEGGCLRSYHLAKGLTTLGHEVTMITAQNGRSGNKMVDGIDVRYLRVPYQNRYGFIRRVHAFLRFAYLAKKLIRKLPRYDIAYVMTTPLTTGLIALFVKRLWGISYYFEVGDLWPEAPVKIGAVNNRFLVNFLYKFEQKCYAESLGVVALSPAIGHYIEATSSVTEVSVIPNFSDTSYFEPDFQIQHFTREHPLKIGYFGTFGQANQLEYLIHVARISSDRHLPIHFTLMGEGATFNKIQELSQSLSNVEILSFGNSEMVKELLEKQHAIYVSFKKLEILNTGSPNKFFDGLAAGKLIVINFGGWIRNVIEQNECGFYHDPETPEEFCDQMVPFIEDPLKLIHFQKQSRKLAETYFSKNLQIDRLAYLIDPKRQKHQNSKRLVPAS